MATTPVSVDFQFLDPIERMRALFSLSRATETALAQNSFSALSHLFSSVRSLAAHCVYTCNAEEFSQRRLKALFQYTKLQRAISLIAEVEIDEDDFSDVACDSLNHLHEQFLNKRIVDFSPEATEQVSMCIFTLKRIMRMLANPRGRRQGSRFAGYMALTQFHLDCLYVVLDEKLDIEASVLAAILNGIGACSLAYATLREGPTFGEQSLLPLTDDRMWDEEDQVLLNESEYTGLPVT